MTVPSSGERVGDETGPWLSASGSGDGSDLLEKKKKSGGHVNSQKNVLKQRLIPFLSEPWETSGACAPMQRGSRSPRGDPRTRQGPPGHRTGVVPPLPSRALSGDAGNVLDTLSKQKTETLDDVYDVKITYGQRVEGAKGTKTAVLSRRPLWFYK